MILEDVVVLATVLLVGKALDIAVHEHPVTLIEVKDRAQDLALVDRGIMVALVDAEHSRRLARRRRHHLLDERHHLRGLLQPLEHVEVVALHEGPEIVRAVAENVDAEAEVVRDLPQVPLRGDMCARQVFVELLTVDTELAARFGDRSMLFAEHPQVHGQIALLIHPFRLARVIHARFSHRWRTMRLPASACNSGLPKAALLPIIRRQSETQGPSPR